MALDFGILQPVNIAGNIMAGQQEAQRNQLAQQQLAMGGLQQEKAQLELADFKAKQQGLDKFLQMSAANGKTGSPEDLASSFYDFAVSQRDPQLIMTAQTLAQAAKERSAYNASRQPPKISPVAPALGALGSGTFGMDQPSVSLYSQPNIAGQQISLATSAPVRPQTPAASMTAAPMVNQLAPPPAAAAAPVNQLGANTNALENRINDLRTKYPNVPQAQKEADRLEKQLDESRKTHVVGRNLVTSTGQKIFEAPQDITPTDIKKLTAERDALPIGHPNRKLYDQAIANLGSTERLAQDRLNFDRSTFAWEKANPGFTIQQAEDGSIVGVNNRTLQAYPVSLNATAPPSPTPFGGGNAPAPGGAAKRGGAVVPAAAPIIQPRGEPLKGKGTALTESQGNATAFGMRMLESDNLLSNLEKAGTISGGRIRSAVEGTLTSLIPYQGAHLAEGAGSVMNAMPGFLGGPSSEQQQYDQAKRNFITAVLRKESGASIGASEFLNEEKKYFPQAGEDDKVIKQKQRARKLAIEAMKIQAGPGSKSIVETSPSTSNTLGATSASDPLGLFNK